MSYSRKFHKLKQSKRKDGLSRKSDKLENTYVIYAIHCIIEDKVYIGKTSRGFEKRKFEHLVMLYENRHFNYKLQIDWNKYGKDEFKFFVIECIKDLKKIKERELFHIRNNFPDVYNIQGG